MTAPGPHLLAAPTSDLLVRLERVAHSVRFTPLDRMPTDGLSDIINDIVAVLRSRHLIEAEPAEAVTDAVDDLMMYVVTDSRGLPSERVQKKLEVLQDAAEVLKEALEPL